MSKKINHIFHWYHPAGLFPWTNNCRAGKDQIRLFPGLTLFFLLVPFVLMGQGFLIKPGAYVIQNTGDLILQGNWVNDGTFTQNGGTVHFAGTTQSIEGTVASAFLNVTIASGSYTTITAAGQTLSGILLSNGTLNANGNIMLLSTTSQTALINGSGTGSVLGNLTMQRYLASGFGYKYISSPFQHATVNEFSTEVNLGASFPTFYRYNEDRVSSGWVNYIAATNKLSPMQGYAANFGSLNPPITAAVAGVVNNGSFDTTLYNNNRTYTLGFNLVGNPYPSPIDWDATSGWTKTNIDDALYFFNAGTTNQYTGTYSTYINGISSDGIANNTIAAMQGFFVHVTNGAYPVTGTLGFSNSVRINNLVPVFKSMKVIFQPIIRLSASYAETKAKVDPVVIYFDDMASVNFDSDYDALKLMNTDISIPNLYAFSADATQLSISAMPNLVDSLTIIPLGIKIEQSGMVGIRAVNISDIPETVKIFLYDAQTGINQDLRQFPEFNILLASGNYDNRFSLRLSLTEITGNGKIPNDEGFDIISVNGKLYAYVTLPSGSKGNMMVCNVLGQVIYNQQIYTNGNLEIDPGVKRGIYIVSFISGNAVHSKKLYIEGR
jgi:hypothetical protein